MSDPLAGLPGDWRAALAERTGAAQMATLGAFLADEERAGKTIFPPAADRFRAFRMTPPHAVRAVILGQDPYHGAGQAHGLSFSVPPGVRTPPSLRNVYRELADDLGIPPAKHGTLDHWARQGVLLLNTVLTVEQGRAGSHRRRGWEAFTDAVIAAIDAQPAPAVFLLWGNPAREKAALIRHAAPAGPHLVLEAVHPSPLGRGGYFGSRHFSQADAFLQAQGRGAIDWALPVAAA